MNHREYIQQEAARNMSFHIENMDSLQRESNTTLTFLYVVIAASFSGSFNLFSTIGCSILAVSLSIVCVYLAALAAYLVFCCLMARDVAAPANEPKNLKLIVPYTSEEFQDFELDNLQDRIEKNKLRNENTAKHLNRVRFFICASPLIFVFSMVFLFLMKLIWQC